MGRLGWLRQKALRYALKGPQFSALKKALSDSDFEYFFEGKTHGPELIWNTPSVAEQQSMYAKRELAYACIRRIANAFVEAQFEVVRKLPSPSPTGENERVLANHPIARLLEQPNPDMSFGLWVWYHLAHWMCTGKSYVWKWRNGAGQVAEMWPMPPSWVTVHRVENLARAVESDPDRRVIDHYEVTPPGSASPIVVDPADMMYVRFPDPSNFWDGVGPIQAASRSFQIEAGRENYLVEMLENTALPGLVVRSDAKMDPKQIELVRSMISDRIGKGKRGSPLILSGANAALDIPTPLSDLDWPGLSSLSETRICAAFGVPPTLLGLRSGLQTTGLSGQDIAGSEQIFYSGTMTTLWRADADFITASLLRSEGFPEDTARFNTSEVKALRPDVIALSGAASALSSSGLVYVNEARKMLGLPEDPKRRDVYFMPAGVVEMRGGKAASPMVPGHEETGWEPPGDEGDDDEGDDEGDDNPPPGGPGEPVSKGGAGSGNHGHAGRPGEVGGSGPGGGGGKDKAKERVKAVPSNGRWKAPPPPRGDSKRAPGGYSSSGEKNTKVGDLGEAMAAEAVPGLKTALKPGERRGPFDLRQTGTKIRYEVKACTTNAKEYKMKLRKSEKADKLALAKQNGWIPASMLVVVDMKKLTAHAYTRSGIDNSRLTSKHWEFRGMTRFTRAQAESAYRREWRTG